MEKSIIEIYQEKARGRNPQTTEVATRQIQMLYSVMGELPNPDPILRKAGKHIKVYNDLLYDDEVGTAVEALELSIQGKEFEIDDNGAGDAFADEVKDMIDSWDNERIFGEIVNARLFGYQPMEVLWKTDSGRWTIKDIVGKPPEWFFYNAENELRFRKMGVGKGVELPPYSFLVPRNKPSYNNPYGVAALSRCFWPVAFKKGGVKFWLKTLEKFGIPFLIGKQPRGSGQKETDKLLDSLEAMIQDAVAVIPDDSSVDILESAGKGTSGDMFESFNRYMDGKINKAIQGQTLTSSDGDGSGSYALGKVHEGTFDNVQLGIMKMIQRCYNEAIEWYTIVNRGPGAPVPKFSWIEDEDVQKDRAERDKTLTETGNIRFTGKYFKNRYNLDDDEFEIVERQESPIPEFSHYSPLTRGAPGGVQKGCQCGHCKPPADPITQFEEAAEELEAANDLEAATEDRKSMKRRLQRQMREALGPVIDYMEGAKTYDQVMNNMADLYPMLNTADLEERLARAMFAAEVWGRISVDEEDTD